MVKIIAFAASNSTSSINKKLVTYTTSLLPKHAKHEILDLNDFDLPIFSEDKEKEIGSPKAAQNFKEKLNEADGFIISIAEHNGNFTASFKNLYDWVSRINRDIFNNKPTLLLSTSPGPQGAQQAFNIAKKSFPYFGAKIAASFSLPSFYDNFSQDLISNEEHNKELLKQVEAFNKKLA